MEGSPGVRVAKREGEATRRRLVELGVLRSDLEVAHDGDEILFPVTEACGPTLPVEPWEFEPRGQRPADYRAFLKGWTDADLTLAPRAFEQLGELVIVKVPTELSARALEIGEALMRFHPGARAVFHDRGVKGAFRTRQLERIAGDGDTLTLVGENDHQFWIDPAKAYFSPRLGAERARIARLVHPGEHLVDLFAGVGAQCVQAAIKGADVDCVDLNPEAIALARRNVKENEVSDVVRLHEGDARLVAGTLAPADRIIMNLPHGAAAFLDVAARLAKPGAMLHYHEIHPLVELQERRRWLESSFAALGRRAQVRSTRTVRNYSAADVHTVFDVHLS